MNRRAQPWLGTMVEITADCEHAVLSAAFDAVADVHRLMSFHDSASDIARFNQAPAGACVPVHTHTWQVLQLAAQVQTASDSMFNIACAPRLVDNGCLPAPAATAAMPVYSPAMAVFRCEDDGMVRKLSDGWIDVGGIAKGYAVDLAVASLQAAGVRAGCVNAGGDLRVFGPRDWPVTIRDPRQPQSPHTQLLLRDEALATSATYFSRRPHHGNITSALLDGRDGMAMTGTSSVSIRAPQCASADALTKVIMACGAPQHPALASWQASAFIICTSPDLA
ncbi:FAD:protein FMN transferase [Duganella sp. CY15W]|uniref:FAD:protein FMN transferase n=1 Tax=Duganella sp. CY15W TaxID=2692172 RepID=UPI001369E7B4|nr:FAD:protein FMN transferase [Duganella sp. CY15W]MYM31372.1 FAD:protein FMN transferase [Duganella sp. CY15W]